MVFVGVGFVFVGLLLIVGFDVFVFLLGVGEIVMMISIFLIVVEIILISVFVGWIDFGCIIVI